MLSLASKEKKELILLGTLNINYLVTAEHKEIKELFQLYGLSQVIETATRYDSHHHTSSLIDVIFVKNASLITATEVIPMSIGDHDMICCVYKMNNGKFSAKTIHCRDYKNYNPNEMCNDIRNSNLHKIKDILSVNDAWILFRDTLTTIFQKHAPLIEKRVKGKPCPWLTDGIKRKMNDRDRLLRKMRQTKCEIDTSAYKRKRNEVNIAIRKAKSTYYKKLLQENQRLPDKFWNVIKSIYPSKGGKKSMSNKSFKIDNEMTSKSSQITNGFAEFYTTVIEKIKRTILPLSNKTWGKIKNSENFTFKSFKFRYVSVISVHKQLKKLQRKKACGLDLLPPNLLKDAASDIAPYLTHIINLSLSSSTVPTEWKLAKITPIYKSGSKTTVQYLCYLLRQRSWSERCTDN